MVDPRYQINLNNGRLTIELNRKPEDSLNFSIHSPHSRVHFDFEDFEKVIEIIEELSLNWDVSVKDKTIDLNELTRFHCKLVSDISKNYNYEFKIAQKDKSRHVSYGIDIKGIDNLTILKESIIKLHDRFLSDEWLDEKIKIQGDMFVEYNGKKITVHKKDSILRLGNLGIKRISDIKGLEKIKYLKMLRLQNNKIEEIDGLDHLIHLRELNLYNNNIKEIKGLQSLVNLEELHLHNNPIRSLKGLEQFDSLYRLNLEGTLIPKELFREAGIKDITKAQDLIKYIKNKKKNVLKYEETKAKTIEYIKKASSVFEEITFSKIQSKTGIEIQDLEDIVEDLIFSSKINAKIRKDGIAFIEENPLIGIALETVDVLHEIKDDTGLISQYTSYIEDVFDKTENIEEYLKTHLASEFEKIRNAWQDYKDGKIDKKEFIKTGIKEIGKKFVKIFIKKI